MNNRISRHLDTIAQRLEAKEQDVYTLLVDGEPQFSFHAKDQKDAEKRGARWANKEVEKGSKWSVIPRSKVVLSKWSSKPRAAAWSAPTLDDLFVDLDKAKGADVMHDDWVESKSSPRMEGACENCGCEMSKSEMKAAGDGQLLCAKCAPEMTEQAATFDPRKAMIYFDLNFEDYNYDEDKGSKDAESKKRVAGFLKLGKDEGEAAHKAESAAMKEIEAMLKRSGVDIRMSNEGHDAQGALIMKFGVNTPEEAKKIATLISRSHGGGDDEVSLNAPYMNASNFRLYPQGVNKPSFQLVDTDEWLGESADYAPEAMQALAAMARVGGFAEAKPKLGSGERYKALTKSLAAKGAADPKSLAAWIGRKKYGKEMFQKLAKAGMKRKAGK